jgi:hypothetical protein
MQDSQSRLLREFVVFLSEFFASSLAIKGRERKDNHTHSTSIRQSRDIRGALNYAEKSSSQQY